MTENAANLTSPPGTAPGGKAVLDLCVARFGRGETPILAEMALTLKQGETLVLVGPSGVGKSTLLRIIAGLEAAFDGRCQIDGKVSMVFQEPTLLPWRSVRDNLCIVADLEPREVDTLLAEVGLGGRGDDFPGQLSLGQQRRLSLARALAVRPGLLLMDEPFVSLDPALVEDMMTLFARLRGAHGLTTILVTHSMEEARALGSRIVTLGGSPARIVADVQNAGAYFQLSASGVISSRS
ncbi:ATP-binding cassette domain-containing protein [uncultured Shimia sp.]|uniref:ABC transporter ATP-binding protein n=1 Tax=uncultured Shimia sp. TaxID=573152 RepID=UPI002602C1F2|nr:ATP-binding cassette domain-containing protein [uncultured Shimia sp.]